MKRPLPIAAMLALAAAVAVGLPLQSWPVAAQSAPPSQKIAGYMTYYSYDRLANFNLSQLTHLIWQGVKVTSSAEPTLVIGDPAYSLSQVSGVVAAGHANGVKVLVSMMGPWTGGASDFNTVIASPTLRPVLVANLKKLALDYGVDGIEVDSENRPPVDVYSQFIKELHAALSPLGKIVAIAAEAYRVEVTLEAANLLDFIGVMTYDMYKGAGYPYHSTYDESVQWIEYWATSGIPRSKLLMGIPFFARDAGSLWIHYGSVVDSFAPSPDQNQVSVSTFNGKTVQGGILWWNSVDLARQKATYVRTTGLGGVMVYEVGTDKLSDPRGLLGAIHDVLETAVSPPAGSPMPPTVSSSIASNVVTNAATLNGNLNSLGSATTVSVSFQYGLTSSYGSATPSQPMTAAGAFRADIGGLTPGMTYHFRAKADAAAHGVTYGNDMSFTTKTAPQPGGGGVGGGNPAGSGAKPAKPPKILKVSVLEASKTSVKISWTTDVATTGQVEYHASPTVISPPDETLSVEHVVELTGLRPCTTYGFTVISKDSANMVTKSEELTFTTAGNPATFEVTAVEVSPKKIYEGETMTVSVTVTNTGDVAGIFSIIPTVGGPDTLDIGTRTIGLEAGASETVTFSAALKTAGEYTVSVSGLEESVIVKKLAKAIAESQTNPSAGGGTFDTLVGDSGNPSPTEVPQGGSSAQLLEPQTNPSAEGGTFDTLVGDSSNPSPTEVPQGGTWAQLLEPLQASKGMNLTLALILAGSALVVGLIVTGTNRHRYKISPVLVSVPVPTFPEPYSRYALSQTEAGAPPLSDRMRTAPSAPASSETSLPDSPSPIEAGEGASSGQHVDQTEDIIYKNLCWVVFGDARHLNAPEAENAAN